MSDLIYAILLSMLPIAELRGGIPFALLGENPVHPVTAYIVCCAANMLVFPITFFFLGFFHEKFLVMNWYKNLFDKMVERTRRKTQSYIDKYGFWGLMVFVMIPLPVTGAYTGSFAGWSFGVKKRKAFLAVSLGVLIAGVIVTTVVLTGSETFDFLIKHIG